MATVSAYEARSEPDPGPCDECESKAEFWGSLETERVGYEVPWRTCADHIPEDASWLEPLRSK
jgi:hypothetical protein